MRGEVVQGESKLAAGTATGASPLVLRTEAAVLPAAAAAGGMMETRERRLLHTLLLMPALPDSWR